MTVRKCSTCKYYEPAPIWRKGWCRNPLLYSPQQSHLVGEDDLDCDRGMGNHWEPLDSVEEDAAAGPTLQVAAISNHRSTHTDLGPQVAPLMLKQVAANAGDDSQAHARAGKGGEMSHFSGSGRFGDSNMGDDDESRRVPPYGGDRDPAPPPGGGGGGGGPERQFTYYSEDRYWTDYLRIAVPVVGVILMLGLVWFWLSSLLGGGNNNNQTANNTGNNAVIVASPKASATTVGTPIPVQSTTASTPTAGGFTVGETVVVAGTGGVGANLRDAPSTSGKALETLADGTQLQITGAAKKDSQYTWWPVKYKDETGYIAGDYLKAASGQ